MTSADRKSVGFRILYASAFAVWLLSSIMAFAYVIRDSVAQIESEFRQHTERTVAELRDKLKANEAVLAGFASFLGAIAASDRQSVRNYASSMLTNYPHIHMLEVARTVDRRDRVQLEHHLRTTWDSRFAIRDFNHAEPRDSAPTRDKPSYRPIVFVWPEPEAAHPILGVDIDSDPHLRQALVDAESRRMPISSRPFSLLDGEYAYVMVRPVERSASQASVTPEQTFAGALSAMAVIKANALLPTTPRTHTAQRLHITRSGVALDPPLYELAAGPPASALERRVFPLLRLQTNEYSTSQPMQMTVERQIRFSDLSPGGLKLMTILSLFTLSLLVVYLRRHHRDLEDANALKERSEFRALHDPLTELPNRNLLADRVRRALAAWRRRGPGFALLFLDLDRFKEINDEHGHDVGDRLLKAISRRLERAVRESDTVARYGGDEFVILITGSYGEADVMAVCRKILESVARPFELSRVTLSVTTSLGISLCPEDGEDFETLLDNADAAMYGVKRRGRNGIGRGTSRQSAADSGLSASQAPGDDAERHIASRIRLVG